MPKLRKASGFCPGQHLAVSRAKSVEHHDHSHLAATKKSHKSIVTAIEDISIDNGGVIVEEAELVGVSEEQVVGVSEEQDTMVLAAAGSQHPPYRAAAR